MNIYISHSRNFDFTKELYEPIRNSPLVENHSFIFPHEVTDKPYNTREMLQNKHCDVIIAEASYPSTGQGIELGWASIFEIPIICIYKDGAQVSGSLHTVSNKLLMYTDTENMISDITGALKHYE